MMDKQNIVDIIKSHEKEISELKASLYEIKSEAAREAVKSEIGFLEDNKYRYEMQAKAWGLI